LAGDQPVTRPMLIGDNTAQIKQNILISNSMFESDKTDIVAPCRPVGVRDVSEMLAASKMLFLDEMVACSPFLFDRCMLYA
jgi:hypothetical protein